MRDGSSRERGLALAAVLLLHAAGGYWFLRWVPGVGIAETRDDALLVEFVQRPRASQVEAAGRRSSATPTSRSQGREGVSPRAPREASAAVSSRAADSDASGGGPLGARERPLDLRLPTADASHAPPAPGAAFERAPALEHRGTRFARAWVPEGDVLKEASWRSPAVGLALSLLGGPPRKCNEVERRLRQWNCLTDEADFEPR